MNPAIARPSTLNMRTGKAMPFWAACFGVAAIASFAVFSGGRADSGTIEPPAAIASSDSIVAPSAPTDGVPSVQIVERRCDALAAADESTRDLLEAFGHC